MVQNRAGRDARLVFAILAIATGFLNQASIAADIAKIKSTQLQPVHGPAQSWDDTASLHVFYFLGAECPVARLYATRIQSLAEKLKSNDVRFIGISSNLQDSKADLQKLAKELEIHFPIIRDHDQALARLFQATRTAEVIVLDREAQVRYRGRVDDQYAPGVKRSTSSSNELQLAIDELLANKPVSVPSTMPVGCLISIERTEQKDAPVTYSNTVAAIFYKHCLECHRPGEIGPFDISNFAELRGWADMIVEVIDQKRMPPWHATKEHGSFKNARFMSAEEIAMIRQWVEAGSPIGSVQEIPAMPKSTEGWRLPKVPDKIVAMRDKPFSVPAEGTVDYQYFVVDPGLEEDRWVSAAQVIPGNASIVHHAIVFIRPPNVEEFRGIGWLTAYVPGQRATLFPPGYARRVPAGSKFVFQMHYTPNGQEQSDLTQIGMNFIEPDKVTNEVFTLVGIDQEFEIPPHASEHAVIATVPWFPADGELLAVMPHMHLRGKAFELRSKTAEAESILLKVPRYDFNWQHTYELSKPLPFRDIKSLEFTASFDNSNGNPFNPAPEEYVMWGDQTWEEMAVAFFEVARPHESIASPSTSSLTNASAANSSGTRANVPSEKQIAFAEDFLKRFDSNHDSQVAFSEVPRIVQDYSFHRIDSNRDGVLSRDELISAAKGRRAK
jgi:peroxiredoxin